MIHTVHQFKVAVISHMHRLANHINNITHANPHHANAPSPTAIIIEMMLPIGCNK